MEQLLMLKVLLVNCIINTNAVIEHGVNIEWNVHVAPSTILGDANIKEGCFIGAG